MTQTTDSPTDGPLMTVEDLSDYLQVPVNTLYAWRSRGTGPPGIRIGRHLRYLRRDVQAWLDQTGR